MENFEISPEYLAIALIAFIPGVLGIAMSVFMWLRITQTRTTLMFLTFLVSCSLWQISEGFLRLSANAATATFWTHCINLVIIPAVVAGLHFVLLFAGHKKILWSKLFFLLVYLPAIYFAGGLALNLFPSNAIKDSFWNWLADPDMNQVQNVEAAWISCIALATMYFLAKSAFSGPKNNRILRARSLLLFIGYIIPAVIGIVCQILFPAVLQINELPIACPALISFSIASFIALRKYNLFDYSSSFPANRILKIMGEGVLIVDHDLIVRYANPGFSRLTGFSREQLPGMAITNLGLNYLDQNDKPMPANDSSAGEQKMNRIITRDGRERIVFYNSSPYVDKSGKVTGNIFIFTDITEIIKSNERIKEERTQALSYQSQLLSTQLNPHFIYNSLNSIQYFLLQDSCEAALNYISQFSGLMRSVLNNSLKTHISLADEIQFLEAYLNLEQIRLQHKFVYTIEVCDEIDSEELLISPMLLQPYVENSIVHGLGPINYDGKLVISFKLVEGRLYCVITDNGIGRENAIQIKEKQVGKSHRSHAMNLTSARLNILNEISGQEHVVTIEDLKDDSSANLGTRVCLSFPEIAFTL
jgi:PAS domain S-box-containing protein